MKKILFTDFCGTLISRNLSESKELYGSLEKELSITSRYINTFLREGNDLVIVTSPGSHGYFGNLFNNQLAKLDAYILEPFHSHIAYYLQGNGKITPDDRIDQKVVNGKVYYQGQDNLIGISVDKKEEAVDDFLQQIKPPYQLYAIGDTDQDIPMLLKVQELGGESAIIDTTLYDRPMTTDEIIKNELDLEFDFELHQMIKTNNLIEKESGMYKKQAISLLEAKEKRKQELYRLLHKGEVNLDELNKNYSKYIEWSNYRMIQEDFAPEDDVSYENYPFNENVVQNVMSMSCYSSFGQYYTKVLKRK